MAIRPMQVHPERADLGTVRFKQQLQIDAWHPSSSTVTERRTSLSGCSGPSTRLRSPGKCKNERNNEGQFSSQGVFWKELLQCQVGRHDSMLIVGRHDSSFRHCALRHYRSKDALGTNIRHTSGRVDSQICMLEFQFGDRMPVVSTSGKNVSPCTVARYGGNLEIRNWTKLCEEGELAEVVEVLHQQVLRGIFVNSALFYSILKRCIAQNDLVIGRQVHTLTVEAGYESNAFLGNHIIRMYSSHGRLQEAMQVFAKVTSPDIYMWASIILAHAEHGQPTLAILLYRHMRQSTLKPNSHIFVAALKACASTADLASGKQVHGDILSIGLEPGNVFVGSCLVDMYTKCGSLEDARRVFDRLPKKDVVTWTAMIAGYAHCGLGEEALALFASMQQEGITRANRVTFVFLLKACASVGAIRQGMQLHSQIQRSGLESDLTLGNCLVDMYAKCGMLQNAREVFEKLQARDVVSWTAMLNGYAEHSDGQMAMQCYKEMRQQGVEPDNATFTCLLVACSRGGLVNEGQKYFKMMVEDHGIVPDICHYNCMVDLLGRSGHLDEAEMMLQTMPFENDVVGLTTLLSACKFHGDIERGSRCFKLLVKLEPYNATAYVLLASLYASAGLWSDVERVEGLRKAAGARKKFARASIEVRTKVHTFCVGEERDDISFKVRSVNLRLKEDGGHVPQTGLVLKAVTDREKEDALCGHAEKLALAYGLLNTPEGSTLLVTKNLRMCDDCHSGTKIMSRLEKREIFVRDVHRVHRFFDGACSCGDRH